MKTLKEKIEYLKRVETGCIVDAFLKLEMCIRDRSMPIEWKLHGRRFGTGNARRGRVLIIGRMIGLRPRRLGE